MEGDEELDNLSRCIQLRFSQYKFDDEKISTRTSLEQLETEEVVGQKFAIHDSVNECDPDSPLLLRRKHIQFLQKALCHLSQSYECLDCSRPWLCYWIVHSLYLLDIPIDNHMVRSMTGFLKRCQSPDGGFGGGPGQFPHLAPTYAAVCALTTLNSTEALHVINREKLVNFLWSIKNTNGSFNMHVGGEVDIRSVYCALSVARLTNCYSDALFENTAEWIASCQTYEGGFSGCPGLEAHGGYAFCGIAGLVLLNKTNLCDVPALLKWSVNRQMRFEGGFQGRPNKLVDVCYSFWLGGIFPILQRLLEAEECLNKNIFLFDQSALQEYILICCQHELGGLIDKPNKARDIYHTCYALSGLSVAQHSSKKIIIGNEDNELESVHSVFNVNPSGVKTALRYFMSLPVPSNALLQP